MTTGAFAKYSFVAVLALVMETGSALGQSQEQKPASGATAAPAAVATATAAGVSTPAGYLIGPDDVLAVVYWREKELSADVIVRPDGMISLPLLNDIRAQGLTPEQLRAALTTAASKFVEEPTVTVVVKVINSRKVFVTGQVGKPGPYQLNGSSTVMQMLAMAGGLAEYAKKSKIMVLRTEGGKSVALPFNYEEVMAGKRLQQNVELRPGDTVVVP
jgi:polysaccharide export outer membrane protein